MYLAYTLEQDDVIVVTYSNHLQTYIKRDPHMLSTLVALYPKNLPVIFQYFTCFVEL